MERKWKNKWFSFILLKHVKLSCFKGPFLDLRINRWLSFYLNGTTVTSRGQDSSKCTEQAASWLIFSLTMSLHLIKMISKIQDGQMQTLEFNVQFQNVIQINLYMCVCIYLNLPVDTIYSILWNLKITFWLYILGCP